MTKGLLSFILLLSLFVLVTNCKTNKKVATENCQTMGTVKDFTGLDGCRLLIVLDNGDKLLPSKVNDENFTLRDGQRIKFDYIELTDMGSMCMAENAIIEITCIELVSGKPVIPECYDANDPLEVPWMKEVVNTRKPASIQKFKFRTDGWAYLFFVGQEQLLYDCQGTLLCEHKGMGPDQCRSKYLSGKKGKVIYTKSR